MEFPIKVIKPEYTFIKLIPNNSLKNTNTHLIARTVSNLYKTFVQTAIKEEEKMFRLLKREIAVGTKWSLKRPGKVSYFVYMEKEKIEFYMVVPTEFLTVLQDRINGVWGTVTMEIVTSLPPFSQDSYKYQMVYEHEDGLSLVTNRTDNDLLNASLNVVELLEEGDKVGIFYNFIPISQNGFKYKYQSTMEKVKNRLPTERKKTGITYVLKMTMTLIDTLLQDISEALAGKRKENKETALESIVDRLNGGVQISESTKKKVKGQIVDTQILILSESTDKVRIKERTYATTIAQSFEVISGDNRLVGEYFGGKFDEKSTYLPGVKVNKTWDEEVQNFIALPGRELLEKFSFMEKIETLETPVPKELHTGVMCIGENTFKGVKQKTYLSDDEQFKKLMLLLIGPTRAGKSNLIANLCIDAIENNECVIVLDFIKKCELSKDITSCFPKQQVLEISCNDLETMQGLGYNEVGFSADPFKQYDNAKKQTTNTLALINAINEGTAAQSNLSAKMERYLECACLVVYISGGSIKDIFEVLLNHEARYKYINSVPKIQLQYLSDYIDGLKELDERSKDGKTVVGTKVQAGIIDRLNALKRNTYVELMLKKSTDKNINLVEEMQKNQVIVIKLPQDMFTTEGEKDIITTYWMTKIFLALQVRASLYDDEQLKKVNLVIDEIYQVQHTEMLLKTKLSQVAKFNLKPIVSCHYINQLKYLREELRSANSSYMLIAGCDKKNFKELKEELYPFDEEDLQNLSRYHSLNYIKTSDGYAKFITELPGKASKRKKQPL